MEIPENKDFINLNLRFINNELQFYLKEATTLLFFKLILSVNRDSESLSAFLTL